MRGKAFITFPTVELATKAIQELHGFKLKDRPMIIVCILFISFLSIFLKFLTLFLLVLWKVLIHKSKLIEESNNKFITNQSIKFKWRHQNCKTVYERSCSNLIGYYGNFNYWKVNLSILRRQRCQRRPII